MARCKPTVNVTNRKQARIRVLKFKYKISDRTIYTEELVNKIVNTGATETWPSQTLRYADIGVGITSSAVEFELEGLHGGRDTQPLQWFAHTFDCRPNHNYNHEIV